MSSSATLVFPRLQGDQVFPGSRPLVEKVQKGLGFIPNLFAAFLNFPMLLEGYPGLDATYSEATLCPAERRLVFLTASVVSGCAYCTAAHSTVAAGVLKVPATVVAAVRAWQSLADAKLDALVNLTRELVQSRWHVTAPTIQAFRNAGYRNDQSSEVIIGVALKITSNDSDHLTPVEIDSTFKAPA